MMSSVVVLDERAWDSKVTGSIPLTSRKKRVGRSDWTALSSPSTYVTAEVFSNYVPNPPNCSPGAAVSSRKNPHPRGSVFMLFATSVYVHHLQFNYWLWHYFLSSYFCTEPTKHLDVVLLFGRMVQCLFVKQGFVWVWLWTQDNFPIETKKILIFNILYVLHQLVDKRKS